MLDHLVVEKCWSMPIQLKYREGLSKWPLRQILSKYVPDELVNRPKMGFGVPLNRWLRGSLKDWAEDLLNSSALHQQGLLRPKRIIDAWGRHQDGKSDISGPIWGVLMFQAWHRHYHELSRIKTSTEND